VTRSNASPWLVVALSARSLAQSAARGSHRVHALDLFDDSDTRRWAQATARVRGHLDTDARALAFDPDDLMGRVERAARRHRYQGLVVGAGLEGDPPLLARLSELVPLCGNAPSTVTRVKDPVGFFGLLDELAIAHPAIAFSAPADLRGWLSKRVGASGGSHVRPAARSPGTARYYQRRAAGLSLSALFLADGRRAAIVGVSQQWTARSGGCRHAYGGAAGPVELAPRLRERLQSDLDALVASLGLVGCNSIDFLLERERYQVLEINPRPSATLDLYDAGWPGGLFEQHLLACRGRLPARLPAAPGARAHALVYAPRPVRLPSRFTFPQWCSDVPTVPAEVAAGMPVCTVHAVSSTARRARAQAAARRRSVELRLEPRLNPRLNPPA
jgi:hypothetical protein